jgi:hypothetical protein
MSIDNRRRAFREQQNIPAPSLAPPTEQPPHRAPNCSEHWTASIVSSPVEIVGLDLFVKSLGLEPGPLAPNFFLAGVSAQGWRPCVVVVSEGRRIIGLLYCKERVMAGVGLGMVFGDDALGAMVAAPPEKMEAVLNFGLQALVKLKVALRLQFSQDRFPDVGSIHQNINFRILHGKPNAHLKLLFSFDDFLARLGPKTRRNVRYYRRRNIVMGNTCEFVTDFAEFSARARRLFPASAHARSRREMESSLTMIGAMPSRFMIRLRAVNGEWIGLAGGWFVGRRAYMKMQLNDLAHRQLSISLVLRSYLIEDLIARGFRELVFVGGSSAPLSLYCNHPEVAIMNIDSRSGLWHLIRKTWATARRFVPTTFDNKIIRLFLNGL